MVKKIRIIILTFCFYYCYACTNEVAEKRIDNTSFNNFIEVPSQFFKINSDKDTVIIGKNGTKIFLPKQCFNVKTEKIEIELREYLNIQDMLTNMLTTTSNSKILETYGMLYINAKTLKGEPISLNRSYTIEFPETKKCDEIKVFYGNRNERIMNWELDKYDESYPAQPYNDDTTLKYIYKKNIFEIKKLGWINCDRFLEFINKTNLVVKISDGNDKAFYSLVLKKYNSIIPGIININKELNFNGIPKGESVLLIGLEIKENKLYFAYNDFNTNCDTIEMKSLEPVSKEELQIILQKKIENEL